MPDHDEQLSRAKDLAHNDRKQEAYQLLQEIVTHDPDYAGAWALLADLSESREQAIVYLTEVVRIESDNVSAQQSLVALEYGAHRRQDHGHRVQQLSWLLGLFLALLVCGGLVTVFLTPLLPVQWVEQPEATATEVAYNCDTLIEQALAYSEICRQLGDNEVCYGNNRIDVRLIPGSDGTFQRRGDIIPVNQLETFFTSPLDLSTGEWGIAVFNLQAVLLNTVPGESVTLLVFGNTEIHNPSGSMQAFYFTNRPGSIGCDLVPFGGILIKTPGYVAAVFTVNGVEVTTLGTLYLEAEENGTMTITVYEGSGMVTSGSETRIVGPGQAVDIGLGGTNGMTADGPPGDTYPADGDTLVSTCRFTDTDCTDIEVSTLPTDQVVATLTAGMPTFTPAFTTTVSADMPTSTPLPTSTNTPFPTPTPITVVQPTDTPISTSTPTTMPTPTSTATPEPAQTPPSGGGKAGTTTTITSDDNDPSISGETITVTGTVTAVSGIPTGSVTVTHPDGSTCTDTTIVTGAWACNLAITQVGGPFDLTAAYSGDSDFKSSADSEPHTVYTANFVVNMVGDAPDTIPGDGVCDDGTGNCSLRAAIMESNALGTQDVISFNIPGGGPHTIKPASALPTISDPVRLDGTTEPDFAGSPVIELDGSLTVAGSGLHISSGGTIVRGLVINRFTDNGILIDTIGGNTVAGNYIGTNVAGTVDAANGDHGIRINDSANNVIGGTSTADRNLISGNSFDGIRIVGNSAMGNVVQGNYIGTDISGTTAISNLRSGVRISLGASSNRVGGTAGTSPGGACTGACNLISGNAVQGIMFTGNNTDGNTVQGNFIGTSASGAADLGNSDDGVFIGNDVSNTIVGGTTATARNVISANNDKGVVITGASAQNNVVQGNYIGTNSAGTGTLPNNVGIRVWGDSTLSQIGGATAGAGNVISGNNLRGIQIDNAGTTVSVLGNLIGVAADGTTPLGNSGQGIACNEGTITIGGTLSDEANTIANNSDDGIIVQNGASVTISGNSIYDNNQLGIELDPNGVTANDAGDGDTGANDLQNYPVITGVTSDYTATTVISGMFNSLPSTNYSLEFFASPACDGSGFGEGKVFLGTHSVGTDLAGSVTFTNVPLSVGTPAGWVITSIAHDPAGKTSEFSACFVVP